MKPLRRPEKEPAPDVRTSGPRSFPLPEATFNALVSVGAEMDHARVEAQRSAEVADLTARRARAFLVGVAAALGVPDGAEVRLDAEHRTLVVVGTEQRTEKAVAQ